MILLCGHEYENGSGRRKRCLDCAKKHQLEQQRQWRKNDHKQNYIHKRSLK